MTQDTDLRRQDTEVRRDGSTAKPEAKGKSAGETEGENRGGSKSGFQLRPPGRRWLYGLAGAGVVALGVWVFRPGPKRVDLVTVERGDLQVTVAAEGQTRVQDRYVVAAPVDGRLARIQLQEGEAVAADQGVARLDPLPLTSQVQQQRARLEALRAEIAGVETLRPKASALQQVRFRIQAAQAEQQRAQAELARAEASWLQAQRDLERANQLAARGALSEQERETAQLLANTRQQEYNAARQQLESAIAAVDAAQEELDILQAEQQDPDYLVDVYQAEMESVRAELARLADEARRTDITTPVAGRVLRILQESARFVAAGTPLLEVGNPDQLEIVIDVLSSDAVKIQPGDLIEINQWGGDTTLTARVSYLEPAAFTKVSALGVEEQRVNVIANFVDANVPLGDGYRVDAEIIIDEAEAALQVPVSALFPCAENTCVFEVVSGRARQTPVQLGQRNTFAAVVTAGLEAGDTVIAYPESVESGNRVQGR